MDQVSLASVMMRLLCRGKLGWGPPGRFRPGDAAFQYGTPAQLLWSFSWKLLIRGIAVWQGCQWHANLGLWAPAFFRRGGWRRHAPRHQGTRKGERAISAHAPGKDRSRRKDRIA